MPTCHLRLIHLAPVVAVLFTVGCGVHSNQPLSQSQEAVIDEELVGAWRLQMPPGETRTEVFFHIGRGGDQSVDSPTGSLQCWTIYHNGDGRMPPAKSASLFTTSVGKRKIANLRWDTASDSGRYTFAKYEITDDQLQLFPMRNRRIAKAIEKGELKGEVLWSFPTKALLLTDSEDDLYKFVASASDEELFGESTRLIFDRVARPAAP